MKQTHQLLFQINTMLEADKSVENLLEKEKVDLFRLDNNYCYDNNTNG